MGLTDKQIKYIQNNQNKSDKDVAKHLRIREEDIRRIKKELRSKKNIEPERKTQDKTNAVFILLIIIAGAIVYANSFGNQFVYDDIYLIVNDTYIKSWKYIFKIFTLELFRMTGPGSFYRPMQSLTLMADYSMWKINPVGYHLTNLLFHTANAILIYFLVNLLFKNKQISLFSSLLFIVHPIHTEAVTYIAGRADPLMAFFCLLSFLLFAKYIKVFPRTDFPKGKKIYFYIGSAGFFFLALLSKESGIIFPLVLIAYGFISPPYTIKDQKIVKKLRFYILLYLPFFLTTGIYFLIRGKVLGFTNAGTAPTTYNLYQRILSAPIVIITYFKWLIFPIHLRLEHHLDMPVSFFSFRVIISTLLLISILAFTLLIYKRSKPVFFCLLWFFLSILMVCNIIPLNAPMLEHWLYLPSIGIFTIISVGVVRASGFDTAKPTVNILRKAIIFPFILLLVFYSVRTIKRNPDWKDNLTFFRITTRDAPHSPRMPYNLGMTCFEKGLYEESMWAFERSLQINPNYASDTRRVLSRVYVKLGISFGEKQLHDESIVKFKKAVEVDPNNASAYRNLGVAYAMKGRTKEAIEEWEKVLAIDPKDEDAKKFLRQAIKTPSQK